MRYKILYEDTNSSLLDRLLKARNITDDADEFLNPRFSRYRQNPANLNDIDKALDRIEQAIKNNEKIMIFGDYDVDGVSASYVMYTFFKKFLDYKNISITLPHRLEDGYGIKSYHLDEIHAKGVNLVITVDNGITAIQEAKHAKDIGLDMIITDHHKALDEIPDAIAVVNPQISEKMIFKEICGATVAFKVIRGLTERLITDRKKKDEIFHFFLPIVTIATVADCMPLVNENRLLVKYGLERINKKKGVPTSLVNFLEYLNIKDPIDTYHIGFLIAPRLNAGGRVMTPYDSLYTLLHTGEKQLAYLENLDQLNTQRKKMQDEMIKHAEQQLDLDAPIILIGSEEFHEGIIGIVAGRLADKHNKPTVVYSINQEKGFAVASLRAPEYASIIDLLYHTGHLLERYGGHKQAGGFTIMLDKLDTFQQEAYSFATVWESIEKPKTHQVDTILYPHEIDTQSLTITTALAPFGESNREPLFLLRDVTIKRIEKVGKNGNGHMKLYGDYEGKEITILFWGCGADCELLTIGEQLDIIGRIERDDFRGGVYIRGEGYIRKTE